MSENDASLPRLLGDRYLLEATLGHGGMGVVYRATDLTMKRAVAVKLIRGTDGVELDEEVADRFLREAKNTARVQHEHIIEVFDLGRSREGDLFFVMELLQGESLSTRLRRVGKLAPEVAVHIGRQICDALHVAHAAGIVHRDLKPANVMLVPRAGDDDYVKVLDFGVAKSYSPDQQTQLTQAGMLVGTVEYMAPEQIMGRAVDGRTDGYSVGIVLYRMLTGRPPFGDNGVPAMIHAHLNTSPRPIRDTAPDVPAALEDVVLRALAKDPTERFASMSELAHALRGALGGGHGLASLEYGEEDPYEQGAQTELMRPANLGSQGADDATVKMERRTPSSAELEAPRRDFGERTVVMAREESGAMGVSQAMAREPDASRACAMCHTQNPPHVSACVACGVSLATDDQDAVRARVAGPNAAHLQAPPPPISDACGAGTPPSGAPPPFATPRAPSAWERFLSWAGLRGR